MGWDTKEPFGISDMGRSLPSADVDLDSVETVTLANNGPAATNHTTLFDSGSTHHISPYHKMFLEYTETLPKALNAANKSSFIAVGKGNISIEVPNDTDISKLHLAEVLYSPEAGYTLVPIGCLNQCGDSTTFGDGGCIIRNNKGGLIGKIPRSPRGIYTVSNDSKELLNAEIETLTPMKMCRHVDHISPWVAEKLIWNGLVTGLCINDSSGKTVFCESCVYTNATRRPIAKVCEGERTTEFGAEVHSDLWGPASVATLCGCCYYVSFTDDKIQLTSISSSRRAKP